MKKHITAILLGSAAITLTGCDTFRSTFGLDHYQADEFNVSENPPLSMPPNYNLAPPTKNSASDKNEQQKLDNENTTNTAKEVLLGRSVKSTDSTTTDGKSIVEKATAVQAANPEIRKIVTEEKETLSTDADSFPDKLTQMGRKIAENAKKTSDEATQTQEVLTTDAHEKIGA